MKHLYNAAGITAVGLALLGVFLPLLPTTPFLLLACACFVRGSPRLHRWLLENRLLGPILIDYQVRRGMALRTKLVALALLWISLAYTMSIVPLWARVALALPGVAVTVYIAFRLKTLR